MSRAQLDLLIRKYQESPDDALSNKINEIARDLVDKGELSPSEASEITSAI
ncbi:hypothetical protein RAJCM14343_4764 [Rhodococcus aetherivorans]|uniref:Uncharacterized protein n=1 Tax=Rhodococcus aetherivorans TaxID=191292 RepID=A0ABQ0YSE9_9NOCA|nr:hypothetical protein [Rhodococcus aetherivorans]ETT24264.1 hypothetical protein RR21198_4860 [Rhodococcus rhodochrous ATCC 21198]MDV6295220.1 hypothetical protein [Rhodococcus aetherivorans]NGP28025.1 hypothetical protein [Rhodococcus aetherivorans]GES39491.1 hypothetical protein RAJCM14343_4764 [Rhodococcus aetherivorans]